MGNHNIPNLDSTASQLFYDVLTRSQQQAILPTPKPKTLEVARSAQKTVKEALDKFTLVRNETYAQKQTAQGQSYNVWVRMHASELSGARSQLLCALQVYNGVIGARQEAEISNLDIPFVVDTEVVRKSATILNAIHRQEIVLARNESLKFAYYATKLWGISSEEGRELRGHFEMVASQLTSSLAQFDAGNAEVAFEDYGRMHDEYRGYNMWMYHAMARSDGQQRATLAVLGLSVFLL